MIDFSASASSSTGPAPFSFVEAEVIYEPQLAGLSDDSNEPPIIDCRPTRRPRLLTGHTETRRSNPQANLYQHSQINYSNRLLDLYA